MPDPQMNSELPEFGLPSLLPHHYQTTVNPQKVWCNCGLIVN